VRARRATGEAPAAVQQPADLNTPWHLYTWLCVYDQYVYMSARL
jgi:hypothetical protein